MSSSPRTPRSSRSETNHRQRLKHSLHLDRTEVLAVGRAILVRLGFFGNWRGCHNLAKDVLQ